MKTYLPFILLTLFCIGCSDDDDNAIPAPVGCDFTAIISAEDYADAPSDGLVINSMDIEGDCLSISFSSSGCDGNTWVVALIDSESVFESAPQQRNVRLSLENNEVCLAIVQKELSFDISGLQVEGGSVLLNITNSGDSILYEY